MKQIIFITSLLCLIVGNVFADKFIVESFKEDSKDLAARKFERKDINGDLCALIKVRTDITGVKFNANVSLNNIEYKEGEYWLFVSPNEKRITVFKEGFIKFDYNIPLKIESGVVYVMVLTKQTTSTNDKENITGFVLLNSTPNKADVRINGEYKGQTPFQAEMEEGNFKYKLSKELYYEEEKQFEIKRNETSKLNVILKPNFGSLKISTIPSEVEMFLDNKPINKKTPCTIDMIAKGEHIMIIKKDKYETITQKINVDDDKVTELNISLVSTVANVFISSSPEDGATIILDNTTLTEKTPVTLSDISIGEHYLTIKKEMYEPEAQTFTLNGGEKKDLKFTLKPIFGEIIISASPNADIYIDGAKVGNDLYTGRLIKGMHTIEIKKEKHYTETKKINIETGKKENTTFDIKPIVGLLSVMSDPVEADIYIDDKKVGLTPQIIKNLLIGKHVIRLDKAGCSSISKTIEIKENEKTTFNETLLTGQKVSITCSEDGAELYLDEKASGLLPQILTLSFGEHIIYAKKTGCDDVLQKIHITQKTNDIALDVGCWTYFTDNRDGKKYKITNIGSQTWMAENLNYSSNSGSSCYEDNTNICESCGKLYDSESAMKSCPNGWHLPNKDEFNDLFAYLIPNQNIYYKLSQKVEDELSKKLQKKGSLQFNILFCGRFEAGYAYVGKGYMTQFWCSSGNSLFIENGKAHVSDYFNEKYEYSVRCIKNK